MSRLQQDCDDQTETVNLNLFLSGSNARSATGTNATIATILGKNPFQFCSHLDFELLTSRGPFDPKIFGDFLEYETAFADRSQVI